MSKRSAVWALCAVASILCSASDRADAQRIRLAWNDCGEAGSQENFFACESGAGRDMLFCSIEQPFAVQRLTYLRFEIDLRTISPVPPWWDLASEGCRAGAMFVTTQIPGATCGEGYPSFAAVKASRLDADRVRIVGEIWPTQEMAIPAEVAFYAFTLGLRRDLLDPCAGCCVPACIVLNRIWIGDEASPYLIEIGSMDFMSAALWQNAWMAIVEHSTNPCGIQVGSACLATPTRASTWGALKAVYR